MKTGSYFGHVPYWTHYIILGYSEHQGLHSLEELLITQAPGLCATRQRFHIFQTLLQKNIRANSIVCSVPCGTMSDLLTLNLPDEFKENVEIRYIAVDLDPLTLNLAKDLAEKKN